MVRYEEALDLKIRAKEIADKLNLKHLDFERIFFYRYSCKTRTIAKVIGFPKALRLPFPEIEPYYVIVVNEHNFSRLNKREQDQTLLHELLHIPKNFSGEYSKISHAKIRYLSKVLLR